MSSRTSCPLYQIIPGYDPGFAYQIYHNCGTCKFWDQETRDTCTRPNALRMLADHAFKPICPECGWQFTDGTLVPYTARVYCSQCNVLFHPVKED